MAARLVLSVDPMDAFKMAVVGDTVKYEKCRCDSFWGHFDKFIYCMSSLILDTMNGIIKSGPDL